MLPDSLVDEFHSGRRGPTLKFRENDSARVTSGDYTGRTGAVVALDLKHAEPYYLVDFGNGTDELIAESALEYIVRAV